jgi:hypothetical protein
MQLTAAAPDTLPVDARMSGHLIGTGLSNAFIALTAGK